MEKGRKQGVKSTCIHTSWDVVIDAQNTRASRAIFLTEVPLLLCFFFLNHYLAHFFFPKMALMLIPTYDIAKQPRLISHIFFVTAIAPIIEYCLSGSARDRVLC